MPKKPNPPPRPPPPKEVYEPGGFPGPGFLIVIIAVLLAVVSHLLRN